MSSSGSSDASTAQAGQSRCFYSAQLLPLGVEGAGPINALIGVRPEKVALGLDKVHRQPFTAVTVEISERRAQARHWNAKTHGRLNGPPQARLRPRQDSRTFRGHQ